MAIIALLREKRYTKISCHLLLVSRILGVLPINKKTLVVWNDIRRDLFDNSTV